MKSFFGNLLGIFGNSWWVEITTTQPKVIYYFGPFDSESEATAHQAGYVEDLQAEGAQDIKVLTTRRSTPAELTIESVESSSPLTPVLTTT